jgi:hypothetical protein
MRTRFPLNIDPSTLAPPDWGDLLQVATQTAALPVAGVAAIIAWWSYREMRRQRQAADEALLVATPRPTTMCMTACPDSLRTEAPHGAPPSLKIANIGPGAVRGVEVRCELLISDELEALIDVGAPRPIGPPGSRPLAYLGAPIGVALGEHRGRTLAPGHRTFAMTARFHTDLESLAADQSIEVPLPPTLVQAWAFHQAVAEESGKMLWAPLRVRVRSRTRTGRSQEELLFFALVSHQPRRDGDKVIYDFTIETRDVAEVPGPLLRQDVGNAIWRRYVAYFDIAQDASRRFPGRRRGKAGRSSPRAASRKRKKKAS